MTPPNAGPTARATLNPAPFSATASCNSAGGTNSGTIACQAGPFMAAPKPSAKVKPNNIMGVIAPSNVATPSAAAASNIQPWVNKRSRRRSTTSASAPAGNATRKTGRLVAACTNATTMGDGVSRVISHAAPTFCIQVPTFDTTEAIQRARNTGCRSGLHGETLSCPSGGSVLDCARSVCAGRLILGFIFLAVSPTSLICQTRSARLD